jgi:hypothetical protein
MTVTAKDIEETVAKFEVEGWPPEMTEEQMQIVALLLDAGRMSHRPDPSSGKPQK